MMKLIRYIFAAVSLAFAGMPFAEACGPTYNDIPRPCFFASSSRPETLRDAQIRQNILLWQQQTSPRIPLADIRQAVYADDYKTFASRSQDTAEDNAFYTFIRNAGDREAVDFLLTAKELEETRRKIIRQATNPNTENPAKPTSFRIK